MSVDAATRLEIEDFLTEEAALLDEWRLDEWLELFTEDAQYVVPSPTLPDGQPGQVLGLIDDDIARLRGRVERLTSGFAYREAPRPRTRRFVTNVRVLDLTPDEARATASFLVCRLRNGQIEPIMGRYEYRLRRKDGWKIRYRRAQIDLESISPYGSVSIIL